MEVGCSIREDKAANTYFREEWLDLTVGLDTPEKYSLDFAGNRTVIPPSFSLVTIPTRP
jgi:hypothetical protein